MNYKADSPFEFRPPGGKAPPWKERDKRAEEDGILCTKTHAGNETNAPRQAALRMWHNVNLIAHAPGLFLCVQVKGVETE